MEQSFRRDLFAFPFGRSFAVGHTAAHVEQVDVTTEVDLPSPRPWYGRAGTWKWATAGTAVAGLAVGVTMQVLAGRSADRLADGNITMVQAVELQQESNSRRAIAGVMFGIGGTAALTSLVLFLLDRGEPNPSARAATAGMALFPDGGAVSLSGTF